MRKIKIAKCLTYRSMAEIDGGSATNSNSGGGSFGTTGSTICGATCLIIWRKSIKETQNLEKLKVLKKLKIWRNLKVLKKFKIWRNLKLLKKLKIWRNLNYK